MPPTDASVRFTSPSDQGKPIRRKAPGLRFEWADSLALPYASAPRIGLATLPQTQAGKGSGVLNACSFLGGTVGVTCGGAIFGRAGFAGVLLLVALSALVSAALALRLRPA